MNIKDLEEHKYIHYKVISGSRAYGLDTPNSDTDIRGVYILPDEYYIGYNYVEQVNDNKNDETYYELKRFLTLLQQNNPNILELLYVKDEFVLFKSNLFQLLINNKEKFLTKQCKDSFGGYAIRQIKKSRGYNKKIVNPVAKRKKTPLDFCYFIENDKSIPFRKYFKIHGNKKLLNNNPKQSFCGLVNIPNAKDLYGVWYDNVADRCFNSEYKDGMGFISQRKDRNLPVGYGFKGIVKRGSNHLRLSSIPKIEELELMGLKDDIKFLGIISYNKDGYTQYCKNYKEYWEWVEKRNDDRYNTNLKHGKNYDSKNMVHCFRLLKTGIEIAKQKTINVYREDREFLLKIRRGEFEYDYLINLYEGPSD